MTKPSPITSKIHSTMNSDPRRPLLFDTKELSRQPNLTLEQTIKVVAPENFGTDVIAVPKGCPMTLDLRLKSAMNRVLVSGSAKATAIGACVRCLEPVELATDVPFQELFTYVNRATHQHEVASENDENLHELDGDLVDLEPILRDAVVPALPFQPVCRKGCPGLCSECGAQLAEDPKCRHEVIDPQGPALLRLVSANDINEKRN